MTAPETGRIVVGVPRSTETRLADAPEVRPVSRPAAGRAPLADGTMAGPLADRRSGANVAPLAGNLEARRTANRNPVTVCKHGTDTRFCAVCNGVVRAIEQVKAKTPKRLVAAKPIKSRFKPTVWTESESGDLIVKGIEPKMVHSFDLHKVTCVVCNGDVNFFTSVYCRFKSGMTVKVWTEEVQVYHASTGLSEPQLIERRESIPKTVIGDVCSTCFDDRWKDTYRAMDGTLKRVLEPIERREAPRKEEVNGSLKAIIPSFQGDIKADKGSPLSVKATQVFHNSDGSEDELVLGRKTFQSPKARKRQRLAESEPSPQGFAYFRKGRA